MATNLSEGIALLSQEGSIIACDHAGGFQSRPPAGFAKRNHPSRDPLRDPVALL